MAEYIEREAALEECDWYAGEFGECEYAIMPLKGALENLPAADVRPVVRAKWKDDWETGCSECSACGESYLWEDYDGVGEWNFCPNCGAEMEKS